MSFILFLVSAEPVNLHDWTCDNWNVVGTVNQPLQKVTCTVTGYGRTDAPRFNPQLPVGLTYNIISSGTTRTVEITGTPSIPSANQDLFGWFQGVGESAAVLVLLVLPQL